MNEPPKNVGGRFGASLLGGRRLARYGTATGRTGTLADSFIKWHWASWEKDSFLYNPYAEEVGGLEVFLYWTDQNLIPIQNSSLEKIKKNIPATVYLRSQGYPMVRFHPQVDLMWLDNIFKKIRYR